MAGVHVVTDGSASLPPNASSDFGIAIVPQIVSWGDQSLPSGDEAQTRAVLDMLAAQERPPVVSAPTPDDLLATYERVLALGVEIVSLHPPRALSDAVAAARAARDQLPADAPLTIVETPWISAALGLLALRAAEAGIDGAPRTVICQQVNELATRLTLICAVEDCRYFGRSSDQPWPTMVVRRLLGRKPVLALAEGQLQPLAEPRGTTAALRAIIERVGAQLGADGRAHVGVFGAAADAEAAALGTFLQSRHRPAELWIGPCDAWLAARLGPGAFGVAFYSDPA